MEEPPRKSRLRGEGGIMKTPILNDGHDSDLELSFMPVVFGPPNIPNALVPQYPVPMVDLREDDGPELGAAAASSTAPLQQDFSLAGGSAVKP